MPEGSPLTTNSQDGQRMLVNNQPTSNTTDAHPVSRSARRAREKSVRWAKALLASQRMLGMETELVYYY